MPIQSDYLSESEPQSDIDRTEFKELKKEIKKAEGDLLSPVIEKGLNDFDTLTEKQQKTFLKLAIDKLKLGKWEEFKDQPHEEIILRIKLGIQAHGDLSNYTLKDMKNNPVHPEGSLKFLSDISNMDPGISEMRDKLDEVLKKSSERPNFEEIITNFKDNFPDIPEDLSNKDIKILVTLPYQPTIFIQIYKGQTISIDDGTYSVILDNQNKLSTIRRFNNRTYLEHNSIEANALLKKAINNPDKSQVTVTELEK